MNSILSMRHGCGKFLVILFLGGVQLLVDSANAQTAIYETPAFTTGSNSPYSNNLAIGDHTLNPAIHYSPTNCYIPNSGLTGFCGDEVAFGAYTLAVDVWGRDNTAIGDHALANTVSGQGNTAVGSSAAANIIATDGVDAFGLAACEDGTNYRGPIACIGQASLKVASTLSRSAVAIGYQAGLNVTDIEYSTLLGVGAGSAATTILSSILIGDHACDRATSITGSICMGYDNGPSGTMSNTLWISAPGTATPILYGNFATNAVGINTTSLTSGAALTLGGGNLSIAAGKVAQWNGDSGISRIANGILGLGNGANGDSSGTLVLAQLNFVNTANFSNVSPGLINVGTGGTAGHGGSLALTNVNAYGYLRPGQTTYSSLSSVDPSPQVGDQLVVTDASACNANTAVTAGGGSTHSCLVAYNGAGWIAVVSH